MSKQNSYWIGGNEQHGRRGIGNKPESLELYYVFCTYSYQEGLGGVGIKTTQIL